MNNQKFPIQPVEDKLIVEKEPAKEMQFQVRDEDMKKTPVICKVKACGPGIDNKPMPVQVGDRVMIQRNAGYELEHDDVSYLLIKVDDIIGVMVPDSAEVIER